MLTNLSPHSKSPRSKLPRSTLFRTQLFQKQWTRWLIYAAVAAFAVYKLSPALQARDRLNGFDISGALVPKSQITHGGPPRDGIPALTRPSMRPVSDVDYLKPTDRVLALNLGGEARAYPIRILNWHEVVNDTVGGRGVVISYCPLCGTGMVFDAQLAGVHWSSAFPDCCITATCYCTIGTPAHCGRRFWPRPFQGR